MNKSDLILQLAGRMNIPAREATSIVNTLIEKMTDALAEGRSIEIRGFGSFSVKKYKQYLGRNPMTGEKIKIAPKKLPCFKVGSELRKRMYEGK